MKEQDKIPSSKVKRATRFMRTGMKVGGNYIKHFAKKAVNAETSKEALDKANAEDIYETLSELKGSALKVAQVLSMERNVLPSAYADIFSLAQHDAPPLSGPLIVKTFRQYIGKSPSELFDTFNSKATHAASIGQVHEASKDGQKLAIKIQYPGVADSVHSDLRMVKPFALRLLNMKEKEVAPFFEEVENKLLEETDYELELKQSLELSNACKHLPNLTFAEYYPELSSKRILTMKWLDGIPLGTWIKNNPTQAQRNKVGQTLWDFYCYQLHVLQYMHSDPHPGNFLVQKDDTLGVLDFGCSKKVPYPFYRNYFDLTVQNIFQNPKELEKRFLFLEMLYPEDTQKEKDLFVPIYMDMIGMLGEPFNSPQFDFGNDAYFDRLYAYGEKIARMPEVRKSGRPRGNKHVLYVNRTFMGLFKLLNELKAEVQTNAPHIKEWKKKTLG